MMFWLQLTTILLLLGGPAFAGVDKAALDAAYVDPAPGAALPMSLSFRNDGGETVSLARALADRPAVLIFADYTCRTLCGPILDFTAAALQQTGLRPGTDYRLIVIGLDPKDGIDAARAMRSSRLDDDGPISRSALFLTGTSAAITAATTALGYHFAYDAEHDQFAHPAAAFVVTRNGKVARVLSGLGLSGPDLRLALIDAGQGQVGTLADRFHLLCYGYDPVRGIYTARIGLLLEISGAATILAMAAAGFVMHRIVKAAS